NPVILFTLRKGIRFHDGQEVTAADVKFTYDTIVDPKNLSPRASDFEPVKAVATPDRYTVRVTYKRLFQPGFERWEMAILPAHLPGRPGAHRARPGHQCRRDHQVRPLRPGRARHGALRAPARLQRPRRPSPSLRSGGSRPPPGRGGVEEERRGVSREGRATA